MSELVSDCPRCRASHVTFDVKSDNFVSVRLNWKKSFEVFGVCRNCKQATIFIVSDKNIGAASYTSNGGIAKINGSASSYIDVDGYINLKDNNSLPPEFLPLNINSAFMEGATCLSVGCFNCCRSYVSTLYRLSNKIYAS